MRLHLTLAIAAVAALAACDQASVPRGSARAPIGGPPEATPVAATTVARAPSCPTVAPACAPVESRARTKVRHAAAAPPRPQARTYKTITTQPLAPARSADGYYAEDDYARDDGLPARPYYYDELDRGHATVIVPYEDEYADYGRYGHSGYGRHRHWRRDRRDVAPPPPPPPPAYRYDDDEDEGYEQRRSEFQHRRYEDSGRRSGQYREGYASPPPAPPPPPPGPRYERYGQFSGAQTSGGYERSEHLSQSEQGSSSYVWAGAERGCCQPAAQAAGLDSRGFLTWPGKTPR